MSTGAGTLRIGRSFAPRMWLALAVIVIAASITLALVITRSSAPVFQPATDGARVGATFEATVPVVPEFIRPGKDRGQVKFESGSGVEPSAQIRPGNHGGGTIKGA